MRILSAREDDIPRILKRANENLRYRATHNAEVRYITEIGFFIAFALRSESDPRLQLREIRAEYPDMEFACQTSGYLCFRNSLTNRIQNQLGDPGRELVELKDG